MNTEPIAERAIRVLLVDDETAFRSAMARRLQLRGLEVAEAEDGQAAATLLERDPPHVVVCDLRMPNVDGLTLLRRCIADAPATAWIILTGQPSVDSAVSSLKLGASEYLKKPVDVEQLEQCIRQAYAEHAPARLLSAIRRQREDDPIRFGLIGCSPHIRDTCAFITQAARSDQPALITGDSGTGKELVARGIHEHSDRASRPFVVLNCAALSDTLLKSELFGHVQGGFAGASGTKLGLFEVAQGGSLFVDEIGDLSVENQEALVRVLDTGQFRRLGDTRERTADVRVLGATVRDLSRMIEAGCFSKNLHQRLEGLHWEVLPLSRRPEDVPALIQHFMGRHDQRTGQPKRLSAAAWVALQSYAWPGNIREMANVIEYAANHCDDFTIQPADLRLGLSCGVPTADGMSHMLSDVEREHILRVLQANGGNKQATARALGISRMKLYRKLELYGIHSV